jgi:hypothetical protein
VGIGANEAESQWYDQKAKLMEQVLGPSHDMVMHAIVPFNVGGGLDLYFYTQHKPGTVFATMELSELPGTGSSNQCFRNYELLMFTREAFDHTATHKPETPLGRVFPVFNAILNNIALFSQQAQLNPHETCEFPEDMESVGGRCLIFDAYPAIPEDGPAEFGLLVIIEIFRSEMEFAHKHGGHKLLDRLDAAGHYPYSDLNRKPVA